MSTLQSLSFDQILALVGLIINIMQTVILPVTLYLIVVQTNSMRQQTTALLEQSKEMTAQTRIFIDTIYSATYQGIYEAESHLGDLMMTYPEASHILMSPLTEESSRAYEQKSSPDLEKDPWLYERIRWLGTATLDFFEHIWMQSQKGALPADIWKDWEAYMHKILHETHLSLIWRTDREYYDPAFRHFIDFHAGLTSEPLARPPLPHPIDKPDQQSSVRQHLLLSKVGHMIRSLTSDSRTPRSPRKEPAEQTERPDLL